MARIFLDAEAPIRSDLGFEKNSAATICTLTQHLGAKKLKEAFFSLRTPWIRIGVF